MLKSLLTPSSIAVIGASLTPGTAEYTVLKNLIEGGFTGPIIPVNASAREVLGRKCYPVLGASGQRVELCIIALPPDLVNQAVKDAVAGGAGSIVIITAGFKESGPPGAQLEQSIVSYCQARNVRLLGPNSSGVINTYHKLNASYTSHMPAVGHVSVFSQSGAICSAMMGWYSSRGLGVATMAGLGNKADISEVDLLQVCSADTGTRVIAGYLESVSHGGDFILAAQAASALKPVVLFKSGVTGVGGRAALAHTGSLTGQDIAYGAAFKRSGIIRAHTFQALLDYSMVFAMQPLPRGNRVAVITNAGGPGIMAVDTAELSGLCAGAPVDIKGDASPERYTLAVKAALEDDNVDSVVVILAPNVITCPLEVARALSALTDSPKPLLACFMGGSEVQGGVDILFKSQIPNFVSPEGALNALKAMVAYEGWLGRPQRVVARFPVNRRRVERIINRQVRSGQLQVGEAQTKEILRAYQFSIMPGGLARTRQEAVEKAQRVGLPVAMKAASPGIIHNAESGGVRLGLKTRQDVEDAWDLIMLRVGERAAGGDINGIYIEAMCPPGRGVILGMQCDPQFGPMLRFGLAGVFVEVMKDVTFHIAPITHQEAMHMLAGTKSFALLKNTGSGGSVNLSAIATGLQRISQLATDFPRIQSMELTPFIISSEGEGSFVADARMLLKGDV